MPKTPDDRPRTRKQAGPELLRVQVIGDPDSGVAPTFRAYLRDLRRERGMSLRDAAAALRVSFTYLQKMETGVRTARPSMLLLQQIAAVYGVPTAEVFAAAGVRTEQIEDHAAGIDRVFRRLVLHPRLAPEGMNAKYWLDSFSTRQKRQWIEFAQRLQQLLEDPHEPDQRDLIDILRGAPPLEDK